MGRVIFPDSAVITNSAIRTFHPSQIQLRSKYSGDVIVLDYGHPIWRGQSVVDTMNQEDEDEVDAWLSAMDGAANWALIPHHRTTIPMRTTIASELSTFPFIYSLASTNGLKVGQFVAINRKIFRIVGITGSMITFMPNIKIALPASVFPASQIPVRLLQSGGTSYSSTKTIDWHEPWRITWEEVVGVFEGDGRAFGSEYSQAFN